MEFATMKDVEMFYKRYAHETSFGVRKNSSRKQANEMVMKQFYCNREGHRDPKWLASCSNRKSRAITRNDCNANIRVVLDRDSAKWVVKQFEGTHNHDMVSSAERSFI
ncbi:FAR1 domain-containing protein [Cephalotus follicularis]|uniref:FAR1 domain-containing protein n=1 Tax=Cephalotus follicularis TaxID=3775 RepID=A0A1Q3D759_CEPFO|nr:FAR1 domain-containing protein [Cephalotus follicularis]